jgi:hypothetical protein
LCLVTGRCHARGGVISGQQDGGQNAALATRPRRIGRGGREHPDEVSHHFRELGVVEPQPGQAVVLYRFIALCLADLAEAPAVRYLPRETWRLLIMIWIPIGGILYLRIGRVR